MPSRNSGSYNTQVSSSLDLPVHSEEAIRLLSSVDTASIRLQKYIFLQRSQVLHKVLAIYPDVWLLSDKVPSDTLRFHLPGLIAAERFFPLPPEPLILPATHKNSHGLKCLQEQILLSSASSRRSELPPSDAICDHQQLLSLPLLSTIPSPAAHMLFSFGTECGSPTSSCFLLTAASSRHRHNAFFLPFDEAKCMRFPYFLFLPYEFPTPPEFCLSVHRKSVRSCFQGFHSVLPACYLRSTGKSPSAGSHYLSARLFPAASCCFLPETHPSFPAVQLQPYQ